MLFVGDDEVKQYEFEAKHAAAAEKWVVGVQATLDKVRQPIEGLLCKRASSAQGSGNHECRVEYQCELSKHPKAYKWKKKRRSINARYLQLNYTREAA